MTLIYFAGLAVLVVAGFLLGRNRAAVANRTQTFHSRPSYHGAYVVVSVLLPMLLVFAVGVPVAHHLVETQALTVFDPSVLDDDLRRGAALRDRKSVV